MYLKPIASSGKPLTLVSSARREAVDLSFRLASRYSGTSKISWQRQAAAPGQRQAEAPGQRQACQVKSGVGVRLGQVRPSQKISDSKVTINTDPKPPFPLT